MKGALELGRILDAGERESLQPNYQIDADSRQIFTLSEKQWRTHCAIIGPTGGGKSRAMWQMMRQKRESRQGFTLIDSGDLAVDFLSDCAYEILFQGNHALLGRLHYLKLGPALMARYQSHKFTPPPDLPPEMHAGAAICWRHCHAQELMQVFQANTTGSTDFLNQPRAHRVLTNVFTALSTEVEHRRLAIEDVFIFFDPTHKNHRQVLDRVIPLLPSEVRRELEMLGGFKRIEDLRREVESSVNRVRMVLGPAMKQMLSGTGAEPSVDIGEIVRRGDYLVVDVAKTPLTSHEENIALASLVALDLSNAVLNTPRAERKPYTVFVDEAAEYLGPLGREIGRWLRIHRKFGLSWVLAFQDLASMERPDFDLAPTIIGMCGTIICFRNRWPKDTELLARVLLTGNLRFKPLVHEVYQNRGEHEWVNVLGTSWMVKHDRGKSATRGSQSSNTVTDTVTNARSKNTNRVRGGVETKSKKPDGRINAVTKATNASEGDLEGISSALARALGHADGTSESETASTSDGWAFTVSERPVPLPIIVRALQQTGQLEESVSDQEAKHRQWMHGLEDRHALVLAPGMTKAVEIEIAEVRDPFFSVKAQSRALTLLQKRLAERHPYFFKPTFDEAAQEQRVAAFVGDGDGRSTAVPNGSGDNYRRSERNSGATSAAPDSPKKPNDSFND